MTRTFRQWVIQGAMLAAALIAAGQPRAAGAHEFWLSPSSYRQSKGDTLEIAAFVGTGFRGEGSPYTATRTRSFELLGAKKLDLTPATLNGELVFARFIGADAGGALVAYESGFTQLTLPAPDFDRYLDLEGLTLPRAARARLGARAGDGRERYARCAKTWIGGTDRTRALRAAGLTLEVVPLDAPSAGRPLRVRVLFRRKPLAGALVRAWCAPLGRGWAPRDEAVRDSAGPRVEARSDREGVATIPISGMGEWLIGVVHMVPCRERDAADWESYWASLTFAPEPLR
ncbi:MAG TPA: DUF4198 domain-containing protein [Candidatus Eisenbacteria bacterium]|jgi:hypothetical protein